MAVGTIGGERRVVVVEMVVVTEMSGGAAAHLGAGELVSCCLEFVYLFSLTRLLYRDYGRCVIVLAQYITG